MYENYLNMDRVPAGAVLEHILSREKISRKELANRAGEYPQRISEVINGKRRVTPEMSLKLEKALGIPKEGFFYLIQSKYEIYKLVQKERLKNHPDLSKYSKSLFWDIDVNRLDWETNKNWIIQRVFENGDHEEVLETISFYGKEEVRRVLSTVINSRLEKEREKRITKYLI